jgi:hypothetical protein
MIWPALYSIRDDAGLESTGLRTAFDGMIDLGGSDNPCANWIMSSGYWDSSKVWINDCLWINEAD